MHAVQLTDSALQHFEKILKRHPDSKGIRLGVKNSGCSGLSYLVNVDNKIDTEDTVFENNNVKVIVDAESLPYLQGLTVDYLTEGLNAQIKFINPNVKSVCGCGESFSIEK